MLAVRRHELSVADISWVKWTFGLIVVGVATVIVRVVLFENRQAHAFESLDLGSERDSVVAVAGDPSYITDGTRWVEPAYPRAESELVPGCVEELWYERSLPLVPSKWSYCFSEDGRLVHKYHWVSW